MKEFALKILDESLALTEYFGYWNSLLVLSAILLLFSAIVYVLASSPFYHVTVRTDSPSFKSLCIAYKFYKGTYQTDVKKSFDEMTSLTKLRRCIGIYYDNPAIIDKGKHRYIVGVVLNENDSLTVNEKLKKNFVQHGYQIIWLSSINNAVLADYPHRTSLAILFAIKKVYPLIQRFIKKHGLCAHPCIEYYENKQIQFCLPLSEQENFYVPEYYTSEKEDSAYYSEKRAVAHMATGSKTDRKDETSKTRLADTNDNKKAQHKLLASSKNSSSADKKRV